MVVAKSTAMEDMVHNSIGASQEIPPYMSSKQSFFFRLPSELKLEVIDYLDEKRDLYNVSKTCKWLEDVVLKRLYSTTDIEIPSQQSPAWSSGRYLTLRPYVVKAVRELIVRDEAEEHAMSNSPTPRAAHMDGPESYLAEFLTNTSDNQLRSFCSMHRQPITCNLLKLLNNKNWLSLRHLSCYELQCSEISSSAFPSNLRTIESRSVGDGNTLGRLVQANKDTLRTLRIGEERALVEQYIKERHGFQRQNSQSLQAFKECVDLADLPNLRSLCLIGLDLAPIVPLDVEQALFLTQLQELTIESCAGTPAFLSALASIFAYVQSEAVAEMTTAPLLGKFLFRQEVFTTTLKDALIQFLNSFSGLRMLSLLFENSPVNAKPVDLIAKHGSTLDKLVIESRIQPRQNLRHDTSRPFGSGGYSSQAWTDSINDVCRLCPSISELSIGFPWNDEMLRIRQSQLPTLTSLKTMHVRNFPEASHLLQMGDYTVKEHAIKFVEWTYGHTTGEKPQLETLSIGPAIYESRFKGINPERRQVPEFLRTHHFALDWAQTRFGRWSAMITPVSEKYMEEVRCEKPLSGVFQQVWLK